MSTGFVAAHNVSLALRCVLLAVVYFAAARLSIELAVPPGYASPIWPPSGIASGALLIWGRALWPGAWLGAALVNYTVNQSTGLAAWIATGNTLEALAATWLARRLVNSQVEFARPEHVIRFGAAAAASAAIAASVAVPALAVLAGLEEGSMVVNWFTWWLGDAAGIILITPLMLAWTRPEAAPLKVSRAESILFACLLALIAAGVLLPESAGITRRPGAFLLLLFAIWAGCRFGERAITAAALALVGSTIWATALGRGPFALDDVNDALLFSQAFACAAALVGLTLHALRRQRDDPGIARLRLREAQLADAQRVAQIGSWYWNAESGAVTWSDELFRIFGHEPGKFGPSYERYLALVHPDDRPRVEQAVGEAMRSGTPFLHDYRALLPDGTIRLLQARGFADRDAGGTPLGLHGTCQDVTERKAAEQAQRDTEERFRMLIEHVRDYAIFLLDADGRVATWNQGAERIKGYGAGEILGRHISQFYPPEIGPDEVERSLRTAALEGLFQGEGWRLRKDGSRFWAQSTITALRNEAGELRGFAKITRDISDRKRAEEDLRSYSARLLFTSRRLLDIQESERRRLASDLHDHVGPNLTALGLNLELLEDSLNAGAQSAAEGVIHESRRLLQATAGALRGVMSELRPQVLADYGLMAALRTLADGFSHATGIEILVRGTDGSKRLPDNVELAMFRIAQEALNNVAKHSRAGRAEIGLADAGELAVMEIRDDGAGFDRNLLEAQPGTSGWGLIIMRERAEVAGARFSLEAAPGRGVLVRVEYRT